MPKGKLGLRMLAPRICINTQDLSKGLIKDTDFSVIQKEAGKMAYKNNIFINCRKRKAITW